VSFVEILRELEAGLTRLACSRIVDGAGLDEVRSTLERGAEQLAALDSVAARDLARSLRTLAESPVSDDDKVEAATAVIGRFAAALEGDAVAPAAPGAAIVAAPPPAPAAPVPAPTAADLPLTPLSAAATLPDELAILQSDPEMAGLFIGEALDHLGTIEAALLALDDRPGDQDLLNDIFRPFHTIKGNAGALGLTSTQEVAHRVENLLDLARSGRHRVGPNEVDLILRSVDVLTLMVKDVSSQLEGRPPAALGEMARKLIAEVERVIDGGGDEAEAIETAAEPTPLAGSAAARAAADDAAAVARVEGVQQAAIKVDTRKLDNLVDTVGELIIVQSLISQDPELAARLDGKLARNLGQLKRLTADLQRNAMAMRMVPVRQAFQKVSRLVRDLSRKAGKQVELVLSGEDTELDRKVVEEITDPLMHMVRNSLDHGIELPDARKAAGKRPQARLALSACHQGGQILLEISDDGAGLNTDRILARAIERGLLPPGATPPVEEVYQMIFRPGFSTAEKVTEISGRGVGMDVVRRNIEALRGRVEIRSERGQGTTFTIKLPLTLAVMDGLLVGAGGQRFVLPTTAVRESLRPKPEQVHQVQGKPSLVQVRDWLVPLVFLGELFSIDAVTDPSRATVVVLEDDGARVGLVVDELLNKQEVVIKSLGDVFAGVRGVAGGAILGDGRVGLILDVHGIVGLMRTSKAA
jgi:two-component system chemotaxis sensor kinase CheA